MKPFEHNHPPAWTDDEIFEAVDSPAARKERDRYWEDLDRMQDKPKGTNRANWKKFGTEMLRQAEEREGR